jgi:hypothetical protein
VSEKDSVDQGRQFAEWRWITSTSVVLVLAGVCYFLGYWEDLRDLSRVGVPAHLMPKRSVEANMSLGFLFLFICFLSGSGYTQFCRACLRGCGPEGIIR